MFACVLFVFTDTEAERNALKEHVYPKLRDFCRENYGIEFQVTKPSLFCKYSTATIRFMTKRFLSLFSFLIFCVFFLLLCGLETKFLRDYYVISALICSCKAKACHFYIHPQELGLKSLSSPPLLWSGIYNANGLLSERMELWGDFHHEI